MLFTIVAGWLVVVAGGLIQLFASKKPRTAARVFEVFLVWLFAVSGALSLLGGLSHIFRGPATAAYIGWPAGNPFQFEVGIGDVALGVLGITAIWQRGRFWLATVIAMSIFGLGAAIGHFQQIALTGNLAPGNAGPPLFQDIAGSLALIGLYVAYRVSTRARPETAPARERAAEERRSPTPRGGMGHPAT